jgi:hypothetical protein
MFLFHNHFHKMVTFLFHNQLALTYYFWQMHLPEGRISSIVSSSYSKFLSEGNSSVSSGSSPTLWSG